VSASLSGEAIVIPNFGDPFAVEAQDRELTEIEQRNVEKLEHWRDLFNGDDMERFVREAYAPTF